MFLEDSVIPLAVFAAIVAIVWLLVAGTVRIMLIRSLRDAARNSPESLDIMARRLAAPPAGRSGETAGLLGMALGAALAVAAVIGAPDQRIALLQAALLPGFMGLALFAQRWLPQRRAPANPDAPRLH